MPCHEDYENSKIDDDEGCSWEYWARLGEWYEDMI